MRIAMITRRRCACGWAGDVFLRVGESALCPDCGAPTESTAVVSARAPAIAVDGIPGGLVLENYGPRPVKVYSHTERKQLLATAGLELKERFAPLPGTDRDPAGIPNPRGYMDPYTLENARILLSRSARSRDEEPDHVGPIKLELGGTFTDVLSPAEARQLRKTLG
jgi:hypothetical protein